MNFDFKTVSSINQVFNFLNQKSLILVLKSF
jgi:hypothetical protein